MPNKGRVLTMVFTFSITLFLSQDSIPWRYSGRSLSQYSELNWSYFNHYLRKKKNLQNDIQLIRLNRQMEENYDVSLYESRNLHLKAARRGFAKTGSAILRYLNEKRKLNYKNESFLVRPHDEESSYSDRALFKPRLRINKTTLKLSNNNQFFKWAISIDPFQQSILDRIVFERYLHIVDINICLSHEKNTDIALSIRKNLTDILSFETRTFQDSKEDIQNTSQFVLKKYF